MAITNYLRRPEPLPATVNTNPRFSWLNRSSGKRKEVSNLAGTLLSRRAAYCGLTDVCVVVGLNEEEFAPPSEPPVRRFVAPFAAKLVPAGTNTAVRSAARRDQ